MFNHANGYVSLKIDTSNFGTTKQISSSIYRKQKLYKNNWVASNKKFVLAVTKESVFKIIISFHHIEKWIKFNISCEKVVTKTCFWKEMKRHAFDTANIILSCPLFYWIYYNLIWWLWLLSCVIHSRTLLKVSLRKKSADTYCSCQCRCHRVEEVKNSRICLPKTSKYDDSSFFIFHRVWAFLKYTIHK